MSEQNLIWMFALAMSFLTIGSVLYSMGGYSGKWKRRFLGSFILASGYNFLCLMLGKFSPWLLFTYPLLILTFVLPYGAETTFPKIIKRTCVVLAALLSGLLFCLVNGNGWGVFIPHVGIAAWSIYMGVRNPIQARAEEGFICVMLTLGLYMYPFIGVLVK